MNNWLGPTFGLQQSDVPKGHKQGMIDILILPKSQQSGNWLDAKHDNPSALFHFLQGNMAAAYPYQVTPLIYGGPSQWQSSLAHSQFFVPEVCGMELFCHWNKWASLFTDLEQWGTYSVLLSSCAAPLKAGATLIPALCKYRLQISDVLNQGINVNNWLKQQSLPSLPMKDYAYSCTKHTLLHAVHSFIHAYFYSDPQSHSTFWNTSCWQHWCLFLLAFSCCQPSFWRFNEALIPIFDMWTV